MTDANKKDQGSRQDPNDMLKIDAIARVMLDATIKGCLMADLHPACSTQVLFAGLCHSMLILLQADKEMANAYAAKLAPALQMNLHTNGFDVPKPETFDEAGCYELSAARNLHTTKGSA